MPVKASNAVPNSHPVLTLAHRIAHDASDVSNVIASGGDDHEVAVDGNMLRLRREAALRLVQDVAQRGPGDGQICQASIEARCEQGGEVAA